MSKEVKIQNFSVDLQNNTANFNVQTQTEAGMFVLQFGNFVVEVKGSDQKTGSQLKTEAVAAAKIFMKEIIATLDKYK